MGIVKCESLDDNNLSFRVDAFIFDDAAMCDILVASDPMQLHRLVQSSVDLKILLAWCGGVGASSVNNDLESSLQSIHKFIDMKCPFSKGLQDHW